MKYTAAASFAENGMAAVRNDEGTWDYINKKGEVVLTGYENASPYRAGLAAVKKDGDWHYIDKTGADAFDLTVTDVYIVTPYLADKHAVVMTRDAEGHVTYYIYSTKGMVGKTGYAAVAPDMN